MATELLRAIDMLRTTRMEEQGELLGIRSLLEKLRSITVELDETSPPSVAYRIKIESIDLRGTLEIVLCYQIRAESWHEVPAIFLKKIFLCRMTIRSLWRSLQNFTKIAEDVKKGFIRSLVRYDSTKHAIQAKTNGNSVQYPIEGRSELVDKMTRVLLADRANEEELPMVLLIVGGPGMGKTHLAQALYKDARVRGKFNRQRWVNFKDAANISLGFLNGTHHGSSYLIVLDDVWYENAQEWDNLIKDLPSKGATILTTRSTAVSSRLATMPTCKLYYLPALQQEFSYSCLEWVASKSGHYPTELYEVCRVVVEQCDGVPLLLKHACDFFSTSAIELWEEFTVEDFLMVRPVKSHQQRLMHKFWQRLFDTDLQQHWLSERNEVLESALVSYRRFTSDLRNCLLYCSVFPLDYIFDVEELVDHLAAQGFIPPMETFAQRRTFLQPLLDDCFYPAQEYDLGVKPMYRMHRIFHMYVKYIERAFNSIMITDQENSISVQNSVRHVFHGAQGSVHIVKLHKIHKIFHMCTQCMVRGFSSTMIVDQDDSIMPNSIRHVSLIVGPSTESIPLQLLRLKDLRTLILLPAEQTNMSDKKCEIKEIPQVLWQSSRNLEVLSLHGTKIRKFPQKIELLHYLRYMDLSWTDIRIIPSSISKLQFLQTLKLSHCEKLQKLHENTSKLFLLQKFDLEGCHYLVQLPLQLSKMKSLECLNILECSSLTRMPCGISQLTNLQSLLGYVTTHNDGCSISELQSLANLQNLCLEGLEKVIDHSEARDSNLRDIIKLESLALRWNVASENTSLTAEQVLECLQPNKGLKTLEIVAYEGEKLPSWLMSTEPYLNSLVEIRMIDIRACKSLPPLGLLPCLRIAEISGAEAITCIDDNFYGSKGIFYSLEKLTFSHMHNLKAWEEAPTEDVFPRLAEVTIIQCPKLTALHVVLRSVKKLNLWMNINSLFSSKGGLRGVAESLRYVSVSFCEELRASSGCMGLQDLGYLKRLEICGCDEMTHLPQGLEHLLSIRSLTIDNCSKLESLPDWLENLPYLRVTSHKTRLTSTNRARQAERKKMTRCLTPNSIQSNATN
uniref:Uncharacterized protein n=1 Tax=Oryza punctata TaxID=4537 RepID=A0A0E0MHJ9_ORYPU